MVYPMSEGHIETYKYHTVVEYKGVTLDVWWFGVIIDGRVYFQLGDRRKKAIQLLDMLRETS